MNESNVEDDFEENKEEEQENVEIGGVDRYFKLVYNVAERFDVSVLISVQILTEIELKIGGKCDIGS